MKKFHYLDSIVSQNITEKSTSLSEFNKIVFKVRKDINKNIIKKKVIGSNVKEFVAIVQPITGGNAPAAPPITIFCGVNFFNQIV